MTEYSDTSPHPKKWNMAFLKIMAATAAASLLLGFSVWTLTHPPEGNIPPAPRVTRTDSIPPPLETLREQSAQLKTKPVRIHSKEKENLLAQIQYASGIRGWYLYENGAYNGSEYGLVVPYEDINLVKELTSDPAKFAALTVPALTPRQTPIGETVETKLQFQQHARDSVPLYSTIVASFALLLIAAYAIMPPQYFSFFDNPNLQPKIPCRCEICCGRYRWRQMHSGNFPYPSHLLTEQEKEATETT